MRVIDVSETSMGTQVVLEQQCPSNWSDETDRTIMPNEPGYGRWRAVAKSLGLEGTLSRVDIKVWPNMLEQVQLSFRG